MQTASDACACSGVISRPDPTLPVDPFDVIEESVDTDATIHDPTFAVEGLGQPPPVPESDALLGMMVPGPDLGPNDLAILVPPKSWNARRVLVALGMGLAPLAGILVALNAHNHLSAPDPAYSPEPLGGIGGGVNATAGRLQ